MNQGDPGRALSFKQGAWRGFALGTGLQAEYCSLVSQTQPPSCTRVKRKPRTQLNTEIQLVIFEPLGLGQTIKLWVWKLCS